MMKTLANHNYIPRKACNITVQTAIQGFSEALNFDKELAGLMWEQAVIANLVPDVESFAL